MFSLSNTLPHRIVALERAKAPALNCSRSWSFHKRTFYSSSIRNALKKDYYEILGVSRNASIKDIKSAYINLAKKFHPDANPGNDEAAKKFQEIADAYAVLSNKQERSKYDASFSSQSNAHEPFEGVRRSTSYSTYESFHSSVDPEELFRKIFGSEFTREFMDKSQRKWVDYADSGSDKTQETVVRLTFREAALGCEKVIDAQTLSTCDKCFGLGAEPGRPVKMCSFCEGVGYESFETVSGYVRTTCRFCLGKGHQVVHKCTYCLGYGRIVVDRKVVIPVPAGIVDGETVKLNIAPAPGDAEIGAEGQTVFVIFRVEDSDYFTVDEYDLHSNVDISLSQALFGGRIKIDGMYGDEVIQIEPGSSSHTVIKLPKKGLKRSNSFGYGDHYVHVHINIPKYVPVCEAFYSTNIECFV